MTKRNKGPVWLGPQDDSDRGGITFSLLSRFLACRERYRLLVVEGLKPQERFNSRMEFGNMWHCCEESFATHGHKHWGAELKGYANQLITRYPMDRAQVDQWYSLCQAMFPLYVQFWSKHGHARKRTPLLSEQVFHVPYTLPSGRVVYLRGKWDSVDLVGGKEVWLQENKTKSRIDPLAIQRQLTLDLQTMLYAVALESARSSELAQKGWTDETYKKGVHDLGVMREHPFKGVRYNVIRRPGQRVGKNESVRDFAARVAGLVEEDPKDWFMRWEVLVTPGDLETFKRKCLNPILEQLCDWWEWVSYSQDPFAPDPHPSEDENMRVGLPYGSHFLFPYGVYNPLMEGGNTELDDYIDTGVDAGLDRIDNLFPELT